MNPNRRATVSLCMIVKNETHHLVECLAPAADLFDDIVIVDTGSQDNTCDVARNFTDSVFHCAWNDDFAAARNESLRHARGDWVFWLDADDRVGAHARQRLAALFDQLDQQPAVYYMDTICRPAHANQIEQAVTHPRLFRRAPGVHWRRRVHEKLMLGPQASMFRTIRCDVQIDHLGYRDSALVRRKIERNQRLLLMDLAMNPGDPELLLELAVGHARGGNNALARAWFDCLLATAPPEFINTRRALVALAEFAAQAGDFQQVVEITERGLSLFPCDDYLSYLRGEAHYQLGQYTAARTTLTQMLSHPPQPHAVYMGSPAHLRQRLAPLGLGEVLRLEGNFDAAEVVLRGVTESFPQDPVAWQFLGRVYIDSHQRKKLDEVIHRLSECPRGEFFAVMLTAGWKLAHGEPLVAEQILSRLIGESPEMPLLRVMRAECLTRAGAPAEQQLSAYRDVLGVYPDDRHALEMIRRLAGEPQHPARSLPPLVHSVFAGQGVRGGVYVAT